MKTPVLINKVKNPAFHNYFVYLTIKEQEALEKLPLGGFSSNECKHAQGKAYFEELLLRLAKKGRLLHLKKGRFFRPSKKGIDPLEVALSVGEKGYLSFATALKHDGLLDEHLSRVFVATANKRGLLDYPNFDVELIPMGEDFYGIVDEEGMRWSTLAKTFYDCLKKPWLAGGIGKVIFALNQAKLEKTDWLEWLYYLENSNSKSQMQKTGFLLAKTAPKWFLEVLQKSIGKKNVVFLAGKAKPVLDKEWMVYHG